MADKVVKKPTQRELSTNNFVALVAIGCLVVVLVTLFFGNMIAQNIILDSKVIAKKLDAKQKVEKKYDNAQELTRAYADLGSTRINLIDHALPSNEDFAEIVSMMENASIASGVNLKALTPPDKNVQTATSAQANSSGANSYIFQATLQGEYTKVMTLVKNLEKSARVLKLQTMQLQGTTSDLKVDITIETYWRDAADISDKTEVVK